MTYSPTTGSSTTISGTLAASGSYPVTVTVQDSSANGGPPKSVPTFTIIIGPALGTPTCNSGTATYAPGTNYTNTCTVSGGVPPYTWTVSGLPSGVTYNPATGSSTTISGTVPASGSYPVTVTAKDSSANGGPPKSVPTFTINIGAALGTPTCSLGTATYAPGTPYTNTCTVSGGAPPYT